MPLSNAEKQARYRAKQRAGSNERRLNLYISLDAITKLGVMANGYGVTKKDMLERAITDAYQATLDSLGEVDSPEWQAFFKDYSE